MDLKKKQKTYCCISQSGLKFPDIIDTVNIYVLNTVRLSGVVSASSNRGHPKCDCDTIFFLLLARNLFPVMKSESSVLHNIKYDTLYCSVACCVTAVEDTLPQTKKKQEEKTSITNKKNSCTSTLPGASVWSCSIGSNHICSLCSLTFHTKRLGPLLPTFGRWL